MEELKLIVKPSLGTIEFNFDEMERRLDKKLEEYRGIVVTEDTKDIAKKNVAELRKLKTESDAIRKAVKKEWNKPLAEFEEKIKKLNAKVDEQVNEINVQLIDFEVKRREEKKLLAYEIYREVAGNYVDYAEYAPFERIFDDKWLNATTSKKKIKESIEGALQKAKTSVDIIKAMKSDIEYEALEVYKETLDVEKAVETITMYEKHKKMALEREEERKEAKHEPEEKKEPNEVHEPEIVFSENAEDDWTVKEVTYRVKGTENELKTAESTLESIGILFERV